VSDVFQLYRFITHNLKNPYYPETPLRFGTLLSSNKPCVLFKDNVYLVGMGETKIETEIFDPTHSTLPEKARDGGSIAIIQSKLFYSDGLNIVRLGQG
jgi:GTP-sensing pleiotropic transcriptional regulator CodY